MKTKPLTSFFSTQATLQFPNHVRELIELVKPKKVCGQYVYKIRVESNGKSTRNG